MTSTKELNKYTCTLIREIIHRGFQLQDKEERTQMVKEISIILITREVVQLEMLILDMKALIIGANIKL